MPRSSNPFLAMPAMSRHEPSRRMAEGLLDTCQQLRTELPEFLGMTSFGSMVRGEVTEKSDADIYVYFDGSKCSLRDYKREPPAVFHETGFVGTFGYPTSLRIGYKRKVSDALKYCGIETSDIIALPLKPKIVVRQVEFLLAAALHWKPEGLESAMAPQNVTGLFHAPIEDEALGIYRQQALDALSGDRYGEAAWQMVRRTVTRFEAGRERLATGEFAELEYRYIPHDLALAQRQYLVE